MKRTETLIAELETTPDKGVGVLRYVAHGVLRAALALERISEVMLRAERSGAFRRFQ